jgi:hypothetical protein
MDRSRVEPREKAGEIENGAKRERWIDREWSQERKLERSRMELTELVVVELR